MKVWLLVNQYEQEGTDYFTVEAVYANEADASASVLRLSREHGWNDELWCFTNGEDEDECWCLCHRQDWAVEGPFDVMGS